jgi:hypothetical protein
MSREKNIYIEVFTDKIDLQKKTGKMTTEIHQHTIPNKATRQSSGSDPVQPQGASQSRSERAAAIYFKLSLARVSPAGFWWGDPSLTKLRSTL